MKKLLCLIHLISVLFLYGCADEVVIHVTDVELNLTSLDMNVGETAHLTVKIIPENSVENTVIWSVDNAGIVSVNEGVVKALAVGTATITATVGPESASCMVNVTPVAVSSVVLNKTDMWLMIGETAQLSATLLPEDAADKSVTWESTDDGIATVTDDGLVTAIDVGTAEIICCAGEVSAGCRITVDTQRNPSVGDFYYSDGSWSAAYIEGKQPLGVVFWTGNPTKSDPVLREDHPECTNGLVVALHHELTSWQSGFDGLPGRLSDWITANAPDEIPPILTRETVSINTICGYGFTRAIEVFNNADENSAFPVNAVESIVNYRNKAETPAQCSGWYLPSPRELSLMCSGPMSGNIFNLDGGVEMLTDLNERIELLRENISGLNRLPRQGHWSSAEIDDQGDDPRTGRMLVYSVWFDEGDVSISFKDSDRLYVRPVLAF